MATCPPVRLQQDLDGSRHVSESIQLQKSTRGLGPGLGHWTSETDFVPTRLAACHLEHGNGSDTHLPQIQIDLQLMPRVLSTHACVFGSQDTSAGESKLRSHRKSQLALLCHSHHHSPPACATKPELSAVPFWNKFLMIMA